VNVNVETSIRSHLEANDSIQETIDWAEIVALLDSDALTPQVPRRSPRRGIWVAVAAVIVTLLIVGVIPLLRSDDPPPADTVVTTTLLESLVADPVGIVGPGSWTVAATFPSDSPKQMAEVVTEVQEWPGVFGVTAVSTPESWFQITGLAPGCGGATGPPACAAGIAVLTTSPWIAPTAERLNAQFSMQVTTVTDIPGEFWAGYVERVSSSQVALAFDPGALGTEQPLNGPIFEVSGEVCDGDDCDVVVENEVDGFPVVAGTQFSSGGVGIIDLPTGGTGFSINDLLVDGLGNGGAIAVLDAFTQLESPIGPRRIYAVAGLPLDAAVVTMELADGTSVWQRPVGGMALFVDKVGSMPERFVDYYDQDGIDPDELEELGPARPLVVLDRDGNEIMRIEDTGRGVSLVTDLRFAPDAVIKAVEPQLPSLESAGPVEVPGLGTLTWTAATWGAGEESPGFIEAFSPGPFKLGEAQVGDTILMFAEPLIDVGNQRLLMEQGVEGTNDYQLLVSSDNVNWSVAATIQAGPILQIAAGDSFWVYGPMGYGGPNIERLRNSATIWISGDAAQWTAVDISFSQWHSIVFVGSDAIYIRGAGAGTDTTQYWIGTFEQP